MRTCPWLDLCIESQLFWARSCGDDVSCLRNFVEELILRNSYAIEVKNARLRDELGEDVGLVVVGGEV